MTDSTRRVLLDISSDLKRVALCLARGSNTTGLIFFYEAQNKLSQLSPDQVPLHLYKLIAGLDKKSPSLADDSLMVSNLAKNWSRKA